MLANGFLLPFGSRSLPLLWTGVLLIGCGTSSIWGSMFAFLEQQFPLSSLATSLLVVAAVLGEFLFPAILATFMESRADVLLCLTLACSVCLCLLFFAIACVTRCKLTPLRLLMQMQQQQH